MSHENLQYFNGEYEQLQQTINSAGRLVVVDFFATWCGPCVRLGQALPEFVKEYPDVLFLKVDVDQNQAVKGRFSVRSIPTIHFFKQDSGDLQSKGTVTGFNLEGIRQKISQLK